MNKSKWKLFCFDNIFNNVNKNKYTTTTTTKKAKPLPFLHQSKDLCTSKRMLSQEMMKRRQAALLSQPELKHRVMKMKLMDKSYHAILATTLWHSKLIHQQNLLHWLSEKEEIGFAILLNGIRIEVSTIQN